MTGEELVESLDRIHAYLCRYSSQTWTEADELPLPELFRRFEALQDLIQEEQSGFEGDTTGRP